MTVEKTDAILIGRTRYSETTLIVHWCSAELGLFRTIAKGESVQDRPITDRSVALIVKARAEAAGLDPSEFSGHSLRAGFITSAANNAAALAKIQEVSRHKSVNVLMGYVRSAELFKGHAGAGFM
jgi:integrase